MGEFHSLLARLVQLIERNVETDEATLTSLLALYGRIQASIDLHSEALGRTPEEIVSSTAPTPSSAPSTTSTTSTPTSGKGKGKESDSDDSSMPSDGSELYYDEDDQHNQYDQHRAIRGTGPSVL